MIVAGSLLELAVPWIIGFKLIDHVIRHRDPSMLPKVILLLTATFVGQQAFGFAKDYLQELADQRILIALRCDLFNRILFLPVNYFDRGRTGELLARITGDIETVKGFLETFMQDVVSEAVMLVGALLTLFTLSHKLTVYLLPTMALLSLSVFLFKKSVKRVARGVRNLLGEMTTLAEETVSGVRVVKAFCGEGFESRRFATKAMELMRNQVRTAMLSSFYSTTTEICIFAGTLLVIAVATPWVLAGSFTLGALVAYLGYLNKLYSPVKKLSKINISIQKIVAAGDRIFEVMDIAPEAISHPSSATLSPSLDRGFYGHAMSAFLSPGEKRPQWEADQRTRRLRESLPRDLRPPSNPTPVAGNVGQIPSGERWTVDVVTTPNQPFCFLDGDAKSASAGIFEHKAAGGSLFELLLPDATSVGVYDNLNTAAKAAEHIANESKVLTAATVGGQPQLRGAVRFRNVRFRYDSRTQVFKNLNLDVQPGEVIALVGASGAGKTTIVNLLLRFYQPDSGTIFLDGIPLDEFPLDDVRSQIGLVSQDTFLFSGTVRDNIAYAKREATEAEIIAAARAANAHDFIAESPQGYLLEVGERGSQLSGGQRQRIAIARALLRNPKIMIFDEATSNLDCESERLIQQSLEHLTKGRTVFLIAHRLSTIGRADRIIVLEKGEIIETGKHEELLARRGVYHKYHSLQALLDCVPRGQRSGPCTQ